jgi:L-ascorbate metabolism protein UlaG (beta-lactamase superfamily)
MDPRQAALATSLIEPKAVIPMHYGTWEPIEQDPEEFRKLVAESSKAKVVVLKPGEFMEV